LPDLPVTFTEFTVQSFAAILAEHRAMTLFERPAGRSGFAGAADAYLFDAQPLHRIAVRWLEQWQLDH
jgi:hypothetical protein